jgi:signal transduction histidine kinase/ligand-binding sensor domain-containing protein
MEAECSGSPKQALISWGPILLASWLLLLAATCRVAGAAPQAAQQPRESAQTQSGLGTNPAFTRITTEQGLSDGRVIVVVQDQAGFMWFATTNGLDRYDGYDIVAYRNDPANPHSLSGNFIEALYEDRSGTLWVGTRSGLNAFDRRTEQFTRYLHDAADPRSLSDNSVLAIEEDRSGVLWIGTRGGLNRFDRASGSFTSYRHDAANPGSLSNDTVRAIEEDRSGVLWIGTNGGLNRFDRASGNFTAYRHDEANPKSLSNDSIWDIYEDHGGTLWMTTDGGGLNRFDRATETFSQYRHDPSDPHSLSADRLDCLFEDASGALWVGTFGGGLSVLDPARRMFRTYRRDLTVPTSLSEDYVTDIVADRSGLIWLATAGGGVNLYNPRPQAFTLYQHDPNATNSLASDRVNAVYEDRDGVLWVGTQDAGLDRFDRRTGQVTHYPPDPTNSQRLGFPFVRGLQQDAAGALWVGTYGGGLYRLDPASGSFTAYRHDPANRYSISDDTIAALHIDRSGGLWIGTSFGGLNRFDPKTGAFTAYRHDPANPQSLSNDSVWAIDEDQRGNIWVGTLGGGLNRLDRATGQITRYQHDPQDPASLADDNVFDIHFDRAGVLWVGMFGGGLDRFDPSTALRAGPAAGTFTHYRERDGLASDRIVSISEDGEGGEGAPGNLWITTGRGLSKLDRDRKTFHTYGTADRLPLTDYTPGHYKTRSGQLLLGSAQGLIAFDPTAVQGDTSVPPIVFTNFQLANQPVPIGGDSPLKQAIDQSNTIQLTYADRVVSLEFAALSYQAPGQNRYRYMLEGFDQGWTEVDASRRLVTYTNLNPGTYVFRVTGSNGSGVWNEAGRTLTLIVTPPWWATWWFRVLALATIVGGAFGVYTWRVTSLRRQRRALAALVADRTRELSTRTEELSTRTEALERAEAEARQSRDELATQLVVSQQLVATFELDSLLERILEQLERIERYDGAIIYTLEDDALVVRAFRSAVVTHKLQGVQVDLNRVHTLRTVLTTRQPLIVADRSADSEELAYLETVLGGTHVMHAWMGIPLLAKERVIGVLSLFHHEVGYYGPQAQARVQLFANQAALAIENAQLYQAAQKAAVLEERNRLAHDLHDAVTQSLFSASLIAEGLRESSNLSTERARQGLEDLRQLTRGALAEMRALLYELRPGGLAEKPLGQLLDQLCMAFTNRTRIPVALTVTGADRLEPQLQEMFYRITQESLNNISKHAAATAARVALTCSPEQVVLIIADDGRGFEMSDGAAASPGMGMESMRERAAKIGAQLRIDSQLGVGTTVTVKWRAPVGEPALQSRLDYPRE